MVGSGVVELHGIVVRKPDRQVGDDEPLVVRDRPANDWVSRGSGKLIGALDTFTDVGVPGRVALDAGASTGGFTAVLLDRGARLVYSVDVGYGQLAWRLQMDDRVVVMDRVNIRFLDPSALSVAPDLVVADLSFISLRTVLPALQAAASPEADFVLMVKPQFEVGKSKIGKKGVVRDPKLRASAIAGVLSAATELGLGCAGIVASPLPGPNGNVEYFLWLHRGATTMGDTDINRAIEQGPQ
jgi:23S rRNA (cytidine1920-2'-O)/16S rRNA (cytidine1409-2'-O)-methyltransferase